MRLFPFTFAFGYPVSPPFLRAFSATQPLRSERIQKIKKNKNKWEEMQKKDEKKNRRENERGSPVGFPFPRGSSASKGKDVPFERKRLKGKKGIDRRRRKRSTVLAPRPGPFPRSNCHVNPSTNRNPGLSPHLHSLQSQARTSEIDQSKRTTFSITCVATRPLAMADFGRGASQATSFTCTCTCKHTCWRFLSSEEGSQGML